MPPKLTKSSTENIPWEEIIQRLEDAERRIQYLEEKNTVLQENYNRLQQMINDTDTKIIVESALRSSELKKMQDDIERARHIVRPEIIHDKPVRLK